MASRRQMVEQFCKILLAVARGELPGDIVELGMDKYGGSEWTHGSVSFKFKGQPPAERPKLEIDSEVHGHAFKREQVGKWENEEDGEIVSEIPSGENGREPGGS